MAGKVVVNEGPTVPAGTYKLQFVGFSSRDGDVPVAKQTDKGLKVYMDFAVVEGEHDGELVPASTDLEGLASWCLLLTGKPLVSRELVEIEKQLKTDKVVEMAVNDKGWVRGPVIPKSTQLAKFGGFSKKDESGKPVLADAVFQNKPYKKVYWQFEVIAGDYAGVMIPASCSYAPHKKGNQVEISSKSNMFSWCVACGVDFSTMPDIADLDNVLPELEQVMLKKAAVVIVQVGDAGWVDNGQGAVVAAPAGMKAVGAEQKQEKLEAEKVGDLYMAMRKISEVQKMPDPFNKDGTLSKAGKKFATEQIRPICVAHGIPCNFAKMTDAQAEQVAKELTEKFAAPVAANDDLPF